MFAQLPSEMLDSIASQPLEIIWNEALDQDEGVYYWPGPLVHPKKLVDERQRIKMQLGARLKDLTSVRIRRAHSRAARCRRQLTPLFSSLVALAAAQGRQGGWDVGIVSRRLGNSG